MPRIKWQNDTDTITGPNGKAIKKAELLNLPVKQLVGSTGIKCWSIPRWRELLRIGKHPGKVRRQRRQSVGNPQDVYGRQPA
jgi:hypothetical protein